MPTLPFVFSPAGTRNVADLQAVRLLDGSFVVAWAGEIIVNQQLAYGSFFQRFSALGLEIGPRVTFSSLITQIDLTALADGGFAVASMGAVNRPAAIFRYDMDGALVQTRGLPAINPAAVIYESGASAMAGLEFGGFVMARSFTDDGLSGIHLSHFDVLGRAQPTLVMAVSAFAQRAPTILALEDGGYRLFVARELVTGTDGAPSQFRIVQRDFNMDGVPVTGNSTAIWTLSTDGAIARMESIATGSGHTVLVMLSDGGDLLTQVFSPTGARIGSVVTVANNAVSFDIKAMAGGGFVLAHAPDDPAEVLVQRYLPDGTPVGPAFASGLFATDVALVDLEGGGFGLFTSAGSGQAMIFDQGSDRADYVVFETPADFNGFGASDFIVGSAFADALAGGSGADIIKGRGGDDVISLGDGRDDTWERGLGGSGNDAIRQGDGASRLFGGSGNDAIYGGGGLDQLWGGDGADALYGGAGDDTLSGDGDADLMRGGEGADVLFGGAVADRLFGEAGDDRLFGGDGSDTMFGGAGDDSLVGGAGNDRMGADAGDDTLSGGAGLDQFLFTALGSGAKTITDFQSGDRISFRGGDRGVAFGDLVIELTGTTTTITLNNSDFSITLLNVTGPLVATDFLF